MNTVIAAFSRAKEFVVARLVDDWKRAHTWLSVQFGALIAVAALLFDQVPLVHNYVPAGVYDKVMLVLGVLVILGRLKKQGDDRGA